VFYGCSGSEANETQIKLIWYMMNGLGKPEKKKIIARKKGYHGVTMVSGSLTGLPMAHESWSCLFSVLVKLRAFSAMRCFGRCLGRRAVR